MRQKLLWLPLKVLSNLWSKPSFPLSEALQNVSISWNAIPSKRRRFPPFRFRSRLKEVPPTRRKKVFLVCNRVKVWLLHLNCVIASIKTKPSLKLYIVLQSIPLLEQHTASQNQLCFCFGLVFQRG